MGISCKQATDYISRKEEGKITLWQRYQLWRHLATCYLCRIFDKQNKQMHSCITEHKHSEDHTTMPENDKNALLEALKNAAQSDNENKQ